MSASLTLRPTTRRGFQFEREFNGLPFERLQIHEAAVVHERRKFAPHAGGTRSNRYRHTPSCRTRKSLGPLRSWGAATPAWLLARDKSANLFRSSAEQRSG